VPIPHFSFPKSMPCAGPTRCRKFLICSTQGVIGVPAGRSYLLTNAFYLRVIPCLLQLESRNESTWHHEKLVLCRRNSLHFFCRGHISGSNTHLIQDGPCHRSGFWCLLRLAGEVLALTASEASSNRENEPPCSNPNLSSVVSPFVGSSCRIVELLIMDEI
jgi:hypothetical protein